MVKMAFANLLYVGTLNIDDKVFTASLVGSKESPANPLPVQYKEALGFCDKVINGLSGFLGCLFSCLLKYSWVPISVKDGKGEKNIFVRETDQLVLADTCKKVDLRFGDFRKSGINPRDQRVPPRHVIQKD
jgi:hypothetical protein